MLKDTSYALIRRLNFIENALSEYSKERDISKIVIADIGCGTGELLTIPLSLKLGSNATIYAYEPETKSYSHLCQQIRDLNIENIHPIGEIELLQNRIYDAIIISEVIEHVQNPVTFLRDFRKLLMNSGIMLITTPNGYGIFEIETMLFYTLELIGIIPFLRTLKWMVARSRGIPIKADRTDTLAISPHINFFSLDELYHIVQEAELSLIRIEGRNFAAGPFSDRIIDKSRRLIEWNAYLGKILPLRLATDWMLIAENLEPQASSRKSPSHTVRLNAFQKIYTRYKRWLNLYLADRHVEAC